MFRFNHTMKRDGMYRYASLTIFAASIAVAFLLSPVSAQEAKQKVFGSPEEAMKVLAEAVQGGDRKGLIAVLGPDSQDIIDSGDEVQDKNVRERFVKSLSGEDRLCEGKGGPGIGYPRQ